MSALERGLWKPKVPVFDSVASGPISSVPPGAMVRVRSEILMPSLEPLSEHQMIYEYTPIRIAAEWTCSQVTWNMETGRRAVADSVRSRMAEELVRHFTIPLRAEIIE